MVKIERIDQNKGASRIVKYHGIAYFTGHSARPGFKTLREQTQAVLARYDELFALHHLKKENIITMNAYLADIGMIDEFNEVYEAWIGGVNAPAGVAVEAKPMGEGNLLELAFNVAYDESEEA